MADDFPATIIVQTDDDFRPSELRQRQHERRRPQYFTQPITVAEAVEKKRRGWWPWLRSYISPTEEDKFYVETHKQPSFSERLRTGTCGTLILLVAIVLVLVLWDVAMAPNNDFRKTRMATILLHNRNVQEIPALQLKNGVVVENILQPVRAMTTMAEVKVLLKKVVSTPKKRVRAFSADEIAAGYASYLYIDPLDPDSDPLEHNFTFDALRSVMKPPVESQLVCEGVLAYGIERNAIAVYNWTTEDADTNLLFNVGIEEYMTETEMECERTREQSHCRIVDIIKSEEEEETDEKEVYGFVRAAGTIVYQTPNALKKRRLIQQPLLACIEHVLKLSGISS